MHLDLTHIQSTGGSDFGTNVSVVSWLSPIATLSPVYVTRGEAAASVNEASVRQELDTHRFDSWSSISAVSPSFKRWGIWIEYICTRHACVRTDGLKREGSVRKIAYSGQDHNLSSPTHSLWSR